MRKILISSLAVLFISLFTIVLSPSGYAATSTPTAPPAVDESEICDMNKSILGIPVWYKYLDGKPVQGKCQPEIKSSSDLLPIGIAVLEAMMVLGGLVAVVMIFVGSFKYVISQGEPDKAKGAQKTVINAVVGLVIVIIATRIVSFIGNRIG